MTNYGCILAGNLGSSAHLLDGWSYKENEEGFDIVQSEWIALDRAYFPQKNADVASSFGFSSAYVTDSDVQPEGDLYLAKITAKGIKNAGGYKVRIGSQSQSVKGFAIETVGTSQVMVENVYTYQTPTVSINRTSDSPSPYTTGANQDPPYAPSVTNIGTSGSARNVPHGWIVTINQEGVGASMVGTALVVPLWFITEEYNYVQEWINPEYDFTTESGGGDLGA